MEIKKCKLSDLKVHPYNETRVPYIPALQLETLKEDIERNGLLSPLIVLKGTNFIIDGKNRFQALNELGAEEAFYIEKEFEDESELKWFILTRAAKNRNLTTGQKAAFAALTVLEMRKELGVHRGRPEKSSKIGTFFKGRLAQTAAREWHVSHTYVQLAINVKKVSEDFFRQMLEGEKTPSDASEFLARLKLKELPEDGLLPEIKDLVDQGKLAEEAAWHLAQLTHEEQKALLEIVGKEGVASMDASQAQKIVYVKKTHQNEEELKALREELNVLKKERESLSYRLQSAHDTIDMYESELSNLKASLQDTVQGHDPEAAARIQYLESELETIRAERERLSEELDELESQRDELNQKVASLESERDEAKAEAIKMFKALRKHMKKKRRRGRKRKTFYMRNIEKLEREIKRLKDLNQALRDQAHVMKNAVMQAEKKFDFAIKRVEQVQAMHQLNTILGCLESIPMQRLPEDIADRSKNGPQAMDMMGQIGEKFMELMERITLKANEVAEEVHRELARYPTTKHLYKNGKRIVN